MMTGIMVSRFILVCVCLLAESVTVYEGHRTGLYATQTWFTRPILVKQERYKDAFRINGSLLATLKKSIPLMRLP